MTERIQSFFNRDNRPLHLVSIVAACVMVFFRVAGNGFVWDDNAFFIGKKAYTEFSFNGIWLSLANGVEYLPVRDVSIALDHLLWGQNPVGFHLVNLLIHAANSCLLYLVAEKISSMTADRSVTANPTRSAMFPLLTALIFAVHPLQSQAVSFITCRNTLLSGLFSLLSLLLFLKAVSSVEKLGSTAYAGSLLSCIAAMLSKATSIVIPPLLMLPLLFTENRKPLKRNLFLLLPFWGISAAFYFIHMNVAEKVHTVDDTRIAALSGKIATAVQIPWFYISKFIIPTGFSPEYDIDFSRILLQPAVIASFLGVCILLTAIILLRRSAPLLSLGISWYIVALVPVLNLFATNPAVADRYAYLPVIGLAMLAGFASDRAGDRIGLKGVTAAALAVLLCLGFLSYRETGIWRTEETLFRRGISASPENGKHYAKLGFYYFDRKNYDKAFPLLDRARQLGFPKDQYALCMAELHTERGEYREAIDVLNGALAKYDAFPEALFQLASLNEKLGDYESAYVSCVKILSLQVSVPAEIRESAEKARRIFLARLQPGLDSMRRQAAANPADMRMRGELALKLDTLMFYEEALREYAELEKMGMKGWELHYNIGNVQMKLKNYADAVKSFKASIAINRNNRDAYNNLGSALKELKDYNGAVTAFKNALSLDPVFAMAKFNLATAYSLMGQRDESKRLAEELLREAPELQVKLAPLLNR